MPGLKKHRSIYLFILSLFFVSCSSIGYLKDTAGNNNEKASDQMPISEMESELTDIKKNQTNLNRQMKDKDAAIQGLQIKILKLEKKIAALEKARSIVKPVKKKEITPPLVLYKKARNILIENNFKTAAGLFTEFIKTYPQNSLADNALYWLGECHYSMKDYKKAIFVFKDLTKRYPKSEKVPDAILKLGYSYLSLNDSDRAHHYLKKVIKKYPFSPAADKAQKKIKSFE
jgi:tol-pal system protein YbgF